MAVPIIMKIQKANLAIGLALSLTKLGSWFNGMNYK